MVISGYEMKTLTDIDLTLWRSEFCNAFGRRVGVSCVNPNRCS